jgi:RNA polymerase sigma-70 factor (ECF subfamily)
MVSILLGVQPLARDQTMINAACEFETGFINFMDFPKGASDRTHGGAARFKTTQWSVVLQAGLGAEEALLRLCKNYWTPLYAFARRRGHSPHEAEDLTQSFFAHILENRVFAAVAPAKGRFRSFLLVSLKHFLDNEIRKEHRLKRGGGALIVSWEELSAQGRDTAEPSENLAPEHAFDREWAVTLVGRALTQLQKECEAMRKAKLFELLKGTLVSDTAEPCYRDWAAELNMSEGTARVSAHRLRRRFGELLREQIKRTVGDPALVDDELRVLFAALA